MRNTSTLRPTVLASAAILTLSLAGCGAARGRPPAELPSHLPIAHAAKPAGAPGASVKIITPVAGSTQPNAFTARVAVRRFVLQRGDMGSKPHARHGHLHFILDGGRYDEPQFSGANGRAALRLGVNGYYSPAYEPAITYSHIPPGRHTLEVELVDIDETPTGTGTTVHFTVR